MKKILVIGDGCIDKFQYGVCERICPEAPVPVFKPTTKKQNSGMAVNVYENIKSLGFRFQVDIITNKILPTKTRLVDEVSNQMLVRVDEKDNVENIDSETITNINFEKYSAVVISDYNKGFLDENDISFISDSAKKSESIVFLDTKKMITSFLVKNIDFIKINEKEFKENFGITNYNNNLIVTLGSKGAIYIDLTKSKSETKHIPIEDEHPVRDLSGAGDTFLASLVVHYLKNNDVLEAIKFANKCASWVVTQKGVIAVDLNKINNGTS